MGAGVKRRFQMRPGRVWGTALKEEQTREWAARKRGGERGAQCTCFHIHSRLCPRGGLEQGRPRSRGGAGFQTSALLNCLLAEMAEIRAGATAGPGGGWAPGWHEAHVRGACQQNPGGLRESK